MRQTNTWGGAIEIQAVCNIWKLRIIVYDIRTKPIRHMEFLPVNNRPLYRIELLWNGYHYEPYKR